MKAIKLSMITIVCVGLWVSAPANADEPCPVTLNHTVGQLAEGARINLCEAYRGQVVVVVNTASKCGFTPQYDGLEALYKKYGDRGFVVLGFPSNDFGEQEPGTEKQIQDFCRLTYGVKFPMFEKTKVRAENADPVFQVLGSMAKEFPQWNFHKYVLDREGNLAASFSSRIDPQDQRIVGLIESLL